MVIFYLFHTTHIQSNIPFIFLSSTGIKMFNHRETASEDDIILIAMMYSIWARSSHGAEFWSFFLSMIYNASRGSESALIQYSHLKMTEVNHPNDSSFDTLYQFVDRKKIGQVQNLHVFVHSIR